jgi:hypothetical protein
MIPHQQHLRHQSVSIVFDGSAQHIQIRRHASVVGRDIAECRQPRNLRRRIG